MWLVVVVVGMEVTSSCLHFFCAGSASSVLTGATCTIYCWRPAFCVAAAAADASAGAAAADASAGGGGSGHGAATNSNDSTSWSMADEVSSSSGLSTVPFSSLCSFRWLWSCQALASRMAAAWI
jgi:hypothetical protein